MGMLNDIWSKWLGRQTFDGVPSPQAIPTQLSLPPAASAGDATHVPAPRPTYFTLDSAIELMRTLPIDEDPELVLRVLRKTLMSTGVSLPEIVDAAVQREDAQTRSVDEDHAAIAKLEQEIAGLRAKIARTGKEISDTRRVRELFEEALESETAIMMALTPEMVAEMTPAPQEQVAAPALPKPPPPPVLSKPPTAAVSLPPPLPKSSAGPAAPKPAAPRASVGPIARSAPPPPADAKDEGMPSVVEEADAEEPTNAAPDAELAKPRTAARHASADEADVSNGWS